MIKVGIIGAAGYVGAELMRLLHNHPAPASIEYISSRDKVGADYGSIYPNFGKTGNVFETENWEEMANRCDVVFLALPHGIASAKVTETLLSKARVIDFGADFRLSDVSVYEQWYDVEHKGRDLLNQAVYGLTEINRERIRTARLIANPGCYTTCSILALYPLLERGLIDANSIIIDAKSGVTGAGRGAAVDNLFCEVNENVKAYKIASHRHTPEIEEQLSIANGAPLTVTFTPHLVPMNRGILAVSYATIKQGTTKDDIKAAFNERYGGERFVRVYGEGTYPETRWVKSSNYIDIGFSVDERTGRVIVISALDNLIKGAAGQAVQNMNIMFGLDEATGLGSVGAFPI